jgi:hypothetical protein
MLRRRRVLDAKLRRTLLVHLTGSQGTVRGVLIEADDDEHGALVLRRATLYPDQGDPVELDGDAIIPWRSCWLAQDVSATAPEVRRPVLRPVRSQPAGRTGFDAAGDPRPLAAS